MEGVKIHRRKRKREVHDSISSLDVASAGKIVFPASVNDIETWLSAAITNQDTCLDAIGELNSTAARGVLREIGIDMKNSTEFTSYSLAIVMRILGLLSKFEASIHHRRLLGFPEWVGAAERRLLEANGTEVAREMSVSYLSGTPANQSKSEDDRKQAA